PRIASDLNRLLLVGAVGLVLQEPVVPLCGELEDVREVGAGKALRGVAEVADVQPLLPGQPAVGVDRLVDVESEVAAALEEEARRRHSRHQAQARSRPEQVADRRKVLAADQLWEVWTERR